MAKQIQKAKTLRRPDTPPPDTRTPSGRPLPY